MYIQFAVLERLPLPNAQIETRQRFPFSFSRYFCLWIFFFHGKMGLVLVLEEINSNPSSPKNSRREFKSKETLSVLELKYSVSSGVCLFGDF